MPNILLSKIRAILKREPCPFCFDLIDLRHTPFRCAAHRDCERRPDETLRKRWGEGAPVGRVIPSRGAFVRKLECPDCKEISRRRLCPSCHQTLPQTLGDYPNYVFSIIGVPDAGKSHYIAVLIHELQEKGKHLGLHLEPLDDDTISRYRRDFYDPVYNEKVPIEKTHSGLTDTTTRKPLVYSCLLYNRPRFGRRRIRRVVTLSFFDTAGEDANSSDVMEQVTRSISRSHGVIFLLDSLQLPKVRERLTQRGVGLPSESTEAEDVLTRVTRMIETTRGLGMADTIPVPLAVSLTKLDALDPLLDPQSQLRSEPAHDHSGFDRADFHAVDAEVRGLLERWDGPLIEQRTERYRRCGFFALSALGCNPHQDGTIPEVLPKRVFDPFLWLLHQCGLISTVRRVR